MRLFASGLHLVYLEVGQVIMHPISRALVHWPPGLEMPDVRRQAAISMIGCPSD